MANPLRAIWLFGCLTYRKMSSGFSENSCAPKIICRAVLSPVHRPQPQPAKLGRGSQNSSWSPEPEIRNLLLFCFFRYSSQSRLVLSLYISVFPSSIYQSIPNSERMFVWAEFDGETLKYPLFMTWSFKYLI